MATKTYISTVNRRTPRPRNRRLRECGGGTYVSSSGTVTYVSGGSSSGDSSAAEEAREAATNANTAAQSANNAATNASAAAESATTAAQSADNAATNANAAADSANQTAQAATDAAQSASAATASANSAAQSANEAAQTASASAAGADSAAANASAAAQAAYEAIDALGDIANIEPITNEEIDELLKNFNFLDSFTVTAHGEDPLTLEATNTADGADIAGSVDISEIAEEDIRKAFENG